MIKVNIFYKNNKINEINVSGHANYALKGNDIVCAGVSSICYACINSFDKIDEKCIKIDDGYLDINLDKVEINDHDSTIIEVMINGLKMISEQYHSKVKICEKEI